MIITGGRDGGNWNSVSKQKNGSMEAWPPLIVGRSQHACGVAELEDNSTVLKFKKYSYHLTGYFNSYWWWPADTTLIMKLWIQLRF